MSGDTLVGKSGAFDGIYAMSGMSRNSLIALVTAGALHGPAKSSLAAETRSAVLRPVIDMSGETIAGCGLSADLKAGGAQFDLSILIEKAPGGRRSRLTAKHTGASAAETEAAIRSALISTIDISSTDIFGASPEGRRPVLEVRTGSSDTDTGVLIQRLLVSGGEIVIETASGTYRWHLSGPAPQRVRATYLMCAGDLFR